MDKRVIIWTKTAHLQRREILKYWTNRNQSIKYAEKLISQTNNHVQTIAKSPYIYKKTDFPKTRVAAMGHYSIFYQVTEKEIIITAFWDNRQNPKKLLNLIASQKTD